MDRITPVPAVALADCDKTVSRFTAREMEDGMAEVHNQQNATSMRIDVAYRP